MAGQNVEMRGLVSASRSNLFFASVYIGVVISVSMTCWNPISLSMAYMRETLMSFLNWPRNTAGMSATRHGNLKISSKSSCLTNTALCGQAMKQLPQSTQRVSSICAFPSRTRMASVGQTLMQWEQPSQAFFIDL